ncbi:hypothetical protein CLV63_104243 [Murinocardiopsis flavida]|uniref:Histidine kinase-like protein n=1 Tax=Murinocardiopsis flavida TaxID=645275 RepID=A0A2P8DP86_9ACTN|nr:ATP-binding protein [Murinocardiopsis flavida]PSK99019.1 hypothetical protein CLV63_104243 [Murinocardiopsis flavida]
MPALDPIPPLPSVTVALGDLVPPLYQHYFSGFPDRPYYTLRRYDFPGHRGFLPLVRAFLDTCAAEHDTDYRYVFTLLGCELASNSLVHSRSGRPGGTYALVVRRGTGGLTLTCRDEGVIAPGRRGPAQDPRPLYAGALVMGDDGGATGATGAEHGRGLALVDALSTAWGDFGGQSYRHVWFHLAYDLADSAWGAA